MDALHALDILTEDCWREVFKKVWSPADLKRCSEACTTFEGILERKRNSWLFHAILPHILPYLSVPVGRGANWLRNFWWRHRNWNAMYTCRSVCKAWRQGTDQYLETHNNCFEGVCEPTGDNYCFRFGQHIVQGEFQEMYEDFTGNPFVGRYIRIDHTGCLLRNPPELERNDHWQRNYIVNLHQILDRFGSEIWSVHFRDAAWMRKLNFCKNIQILLGMLPNLRSLELNSSTGCRRGEGMSQLPTFLAANPLPDNRNLENLSLMGLHIFMARPLLEKYGPQLKSLQIRDVTAFGEKVRLFQHLQKLEIWGCEVSESLKELRQLRSPLSSLTIHVQLGPRSRTFPIDELIRNIQHLPVADLIISTWNPLKGTLSAFPDSLRHCSVRRVRMTSFTGNIISCNFLRCFPNLEGIHFNYYYRGIPQPGHRSNILVVTSQEKDMYDSGIWDILPHLQIISVKATYRQRPQVYRRSTFAMRRFEETMEVLASLF